VVVMTYGVLCWLGDLPAVMRIVAERLAPGGRFLLIDCHPLLQQLSDDPERDGWRLLPAGYFHQPEPERCVSSHSYTGQGSLAHAESFQWSHHPAEIIRATLAAGLAIRDLREEPYGFYRRFAGMTRNAAGYYALPPQAPKIPLMFALLAERPGR